MSARRTAEAALRRLTPRLRSRRTWAVLTLLLAGAAALYVHTLDDTLHSVAPSRLILDRRGQYLGEVPAGNGELGYWPLPYVLPERVVAATLVTEDQYFYEHPGVYLPSVGRAIFQNVRNG